MDARLRGHDEKGKWMPAGVYPAGLPLDRGHDEEKGDIRHTTLGDRVLPDAAPSVGN